MQSPILVRRLSPEDRPSLDRMYQTFDPAEGAMGLPPSDPERRHEWLKGLEGAINLGAFVEGKLAGHLALLPGNRIAEMCCFVHQDFRRRGVAMALGRAAVEECYKAGIAAMWVLIDSGNLAARHGLLKFGFHAAWEDLREGQYVFPVRKAEAAA